MRCLSARRGLRSAAVVGALGLALAACGGGGSGSAGGAQQQAPAGEAYAGPVGQGEGKLSVLAWPGYAEDGSTDPAVDWVTPFERATGCQVSVKTFATSAEAVQLFGTGEYDVVSASGDASLRLVYGDRVQPVNTGLVPNYADIIPDLKDKPWNTVGGKNYGIPHGRGANLLLYNTAAHSTAPTSWKDMWEPGSPAAGKISPYDDGIYIADAAVYLMATQPDLKITNPYALDQRQFDAAIALLKQQKPMVSEYWADVVKQGQGLSSGALSEGQGWQLTANLANTDAPNTVGTVKPTEGATGWSDTWMVKKDTPNINCAYQWLNHVISPEVNAQIAEYFGEAPANTKSCALTKDRNHCATYHAQETDFWDNVYYWTTPTEDCLDGRTDVKCVPYDQWVRSWSELRSA
ncbi:extracellular solute-binding protein [Pseudonocardia kujensis]|uniref:extracellular solute-binding protein n=1 Tax=Pseudonocardia kujensis TaxID=1128675 RepID=UPI001E3411FE|nr:extracellular solute-binding protein [Pseudonocardia kujensis]MCE0761615.1 extracellular solute-binding protein [Pseudonocardia kujensis]